jgi:hypothetical protein
VSSAYRDERKVDTWGVAFGVVPLVHVETASTRPVQIATLCKVFVYKVADEGVVDVRSLRHTGAKTAYLFASPAFTETTVKETRKSLDDIPFNRRRCGRAKKEERTR